MEPFSTEHIVEDADIAIIGMAGQFPGADDPAQLWQALVEGRELIQVVTEEQCRRAGVEEHLLTDPAYVRAAAMPSAFEEFDATFFDMAAREVELTDPQHRVFLECAWHALESAGYAVRGAQHLVSVFGGATMSTYLPLHLARNTEVQRTVEPVQLNIGNGSDFLTTRAAYKLDLRGACHSVQSACSTSLVAVHVACQALLNRECDLALAGGVSINLALRYGYRHLEGGMASPDGHCRPFDADARGTVFTSGAAMVVLKPLRQAVADGDVIHAVLKGTAINNDGAYKVGYTAPSIEGQARVIAEAMAAAGLSARDISYVEAHGTGTALGDPIEVQALARAFDQTASRRDKCGLGSIKGNLGHLDAAAGVTGLIKTVLALEKEHLPATLHFQRPNPALDLATTPFEVVATLQRWPRGETPRRAGVSSFGVGGTNAHVIVEEAPVQGPSSAGRAAMILPLSARSDSALRTSAERLTAWLREHPQANLQDVAWTLQARRQRFEHRHVVVCRDTTEALAALASMPTTIKQDAIGRVVAFLFPGQGSQRPGMASALYASEPSFRAELDRGLDLLAASEGLDLRALLLQASDEQDRAREQMTQTSIAQPALFLFEYAAARLWQSWGVEPQVMLGHSVGEYVAACLADVFSLETGLRLVAARGRLMQTLPPGAMLAVSLPEEELSGYLRPGLSLAAVNASTQGVVAGPVAAIGLFERELAMQGVRCQRLATSHAFHSSMMDPIVDQMATLVAAARPASPKRPFVSNVTGTWITPTQATDPTYWARHLREPVRFHAGLQEVLADPQRIVLECGPGQALGRLARRHPAAGPSREIHATSADPEQPAGSVPLVLQTLGQLWRAGVDVNWTGVHAGERRRQLPLPTYPFERRRYWIEPSSRPDASAPHASLAANAAAPDSPPISTGTLHPRPMLRNTFVAPASERERQLVELWQRTLGVAPIGVLDNFFELGGDSLLALQLSEQLKQQLGVSLPAASLYEGVTISALAALLEEASGKTPPQATGHQSDLEEEGDQERRTRRKQSLERLRSSRRSEDDEELDS